MPVKVLIVEDNPVARGFLVRVVRASFTDELTIVEAADLRSARRAIGWHAGLGTPVPADTVQLLLLDLELPDGNGMELLAEMVGHPSTRIVTTLYSDDEHLFPALQQGADGYLLKEDRFEMLVDELQKIVRGEPPLSPAIARRLLTHFRGGALPPAPPPLPFASRPPMPRPAAFDHQRLTPRENEVLTYLSKGFTIKEIANLMGIKWFTVNDHIKSIYKKLDVSSRAEAAVLASRQGLV